MFITILLKCLGSALLVSGQSLTTAFYHDEHLSFNDDITPEKFPDNFKIGVSTAAYQIEGGWNADGKGSSIWDTFTHNHPELIADHTTADVGADSYHLYEHDIAALKEVGVDFYRFSIAWSRILPQGILSSGVNRAGIAYYNKLIDALLAANIEPVVTMYHYDLPQTIQDLGGLTNPLFVKFFYDYARILYESFGDRVKRWITFNEPFDCCVEGYGTAAVAPLISVPGIAEYICTHNVLEAHAAAYNLYRRQFRSKFSGKVGITLDSRFFYEKGSNRTNEVTERAMQFMLGWYGHPIFSEDGGYPQVMIDEVGDRLPTMTTKAKHFIRGTADFLGLNYYSSRYAELIDVEHVKKSWEIDSRIKMSVDPNWPKSKSSWLYSVPQGLGDILRWIKKNYNNVEVFITENGWSDDGQLNDIERIDYLKVLSLKMFFF